jgi:hypothetical protein
MVVHVCNTSYSGGRDQEDQGLRPAQNKQFVKPYFENTCHKNRAGGVAQGVGPEFKPQNSQKKKKKKPKTDQRSKCETTMGKHLTIEA